MKLVSVRRQVRVKIKNQVQDQVWNPLSNLITADIRLHVYNRVCIQISDYIRFQAMIPVMYEAREQL